jgi:hypothetical protein
LGGRFAATGIRLQAKEVDLKPQEVNGQARVVKCKHVQQFKDDGHANGDSSKMRWATGTGIQP